MSGVKMNHATVIKKVKIFAKEIWGLDFNLPIEFSTRMTSSLGCVKSKRRPLNTPLPIKMVLAANLFQGDYKEETIDGVILHETCHWALMVLGKPFADGHPVFEAELKRIGASSTRTITGAGEVHIFCCSKCNQEIGTLNDRQAKNLIKKLNNPYKLITTKCCNAKVKYMGKQYKEDDNITQQAKDSRVQNTIAAMSVAQPSISAKNTSIVVPKGPKGQVTNNTIMPVLKQLVKTNNIEGIREVRSQHPEVFNSTIKYLSKKEQEVIKGVK